MAKEINIHQEIIASRGQQVTQRMVGGLQEAGGQRNQKALAAIPDSKGILLSEMKQYLKQEQQWKVPSLCSGKINASGWKRGYGNDGAYSKDLASICGAG